MTSKRDESLEGTRRRIRWAEERGGHFSKAQKAFLEEASWQGYREYRLDEPHRGMTDAQRKMKLDMIGRWRQGLENLELLTDVFSQYKGLGTSETRGAWFRENDARKVLDRDTILNLVRMSIRFFGREYADAILTVLGQEAYAGAEEEIVIQRKVYRLPAGLRP